MAWKGTHSDAGFTLVEMVLASALTLVVILMGYGVLDTSSNTANEVAVRSVNSANAREAIDAIDTDLRSATSVWVCAGLPTATTCVAPTARTSVASWLRSSAATLFVSNASGGTEPTCAAWTIPLTGLGLQEYRGSGSAATLIFTLPGVMAWVPPLGSASTTQSAGFSMAAATGSQLIVVDLLVNSAVAATATPSAFDTGDAVSVHDMTAPNNVPVTPVTLTTALAVSPNTTTLAVGALATAIPAGGLVTVNSGTNSQIFTATAAAAVGATAVSVTSIAANFAYPTTSTAFSSPPLAACI